MRAILIDAAKREVKEVTIDADKNVLHQWYDLLNCQLVETGHYINEHDSILVDEEGLLKGFVKTYFHYNGAHQPFAGSGLVVGVDEMGRTVDCNITLEEVTENVMFLTEDALYAYYYTDEQEERNHTEGSFD